MDCFNRWRRWIRPLVMLVYILLLTIALPLCIWELNKRKKEVHVQAWFVGGLFVMMSLPISLWGIVQHLVYYTQPLLQRNIIRILWMVPIYALNAWLALRFPRAAIYLDTVRECYEAYVIYNFMRYLMNYLHQEHPHLDIELENKAQVKHMIPFCLLPPWPMGKLFLQRCKHGVLQYTIVRPATTVIALLCELGGKYDEGDFNFTTAWSYLVIVNNISQIWAMYCLILFYKSAKEELAPIKPLPKFLCVKAVVFLSFWQSVVIAALAKLGVIPQNGPWLFYNSVKEEATGLQDFCICIEMFFAAVAHYFSFSHKPYMDEEADQSNCCSSFLSMWDVRDVRDDVIEHARYVGKGLTRRLVRRKDDKRGERTPLLNGPSNSATSINDATSGTKLNTPPIVVSDDFIESVATDWDGSSVDQTHDSFVNQSATASMNNYVDFSTSVEAAACRDYQDQSLAAAGSMSSLNKVGKSVKGKVETETVTVHPVTESGIAVQSDPPLVDLSGEDAVSDDIPASDQVAGAPQEGPQLQQTQNTKDEEVDISIDKDISLTGSHPPTGPDTGRTENV
ncbi:transmembrane protein 184C-like [Haliotis cracherodii]|uniref:transmembrane protein 184C-like n=1 Tax=Haliotis cracherodii TaxID=6455 RepID=UPI0039E77B80